MRATWAPRGRTPILTHHFNWKRLSMASALAFAPDGSDAALVFSMRAGSFNDEALIEFISEMRDLLGGDKATLIWDGLTSHRSRAMTAFLTTQRHWLVTERLPPYGHDLNPVEQVWGNLKNRELANLCPDTVEEAAVFADDGLMRIGEDTRLCFSFLKHCGLSL